MPDTDAQGLGGRACTHLFPSVDGDIDTLQNQVQVLSVTQAIVPEFHAAHLGPVAGWSHLLDSPGSLRSGRSKGSEGCSRGPMAPRGPTATTPPPAPPSLAPSAPHRLPAIPGPRPQGTHTQVEHPGLCTSGFLCPEGSSSKDPPGLLPPVRQISGQLGRPRPLPGSLLLQRHSASPSILGLYWHLYSVTPAHWNIHSRRTGSLIVGPLLYPRAQRTQ